MTPGNHKVANPQGIYVGDTKKGKIEIVATVGGISYKTSWDRGTEFSADDAWALLMTMPEGSYASPVRI
jgi:ribosomal protein S11